MFRVAVLALAASPALVLPVASHAQAGRWKPEQNVEIIIPTSAGTGSDATGRFIQRLLTERKLIEAPSVVVNKPGGAATVGLSYLNLHVGEGHYFMVANPALVTSFITGASKISHNDVTPLAVLGRESVVFAVRADSPLKTAKEAADRLRTDLAGFTVAFANALGNQNHIAAAQVVKGVGANPKALKTVVFNGSGEGVAALLGGHVDAITISASPLLQHVKAGRVRILAVSSDQRLGDVLATVPTWQELGIASISSNWRGLVGPRGMSEGQIAYWDEVFARLSQLPEWRQDLERKLIETTYLNSRDAKRQIDTEYAELSKLLAELGLAK
jgi:putative tricarboxylic transport membrane protein